MGSAIINNLLSSSFSSDQISVLKPSKENQISGIKYFSKYEEFLENYSANIIFFAFKPQDAKSILEDLKKYQPFDKNTIFISILAGKKIQFFEEIFGDKIKLIRLMPNLPILVGEGFFSYFCNKNIENTETTKISDSILNSLGKNIKLKDEDLMDAATAIAGSGPAYLFSFADAIFEATKKAGFDEKEALELTKQTIFGSAKLLNESKESFKQLSKNVTSKGGVTEAALDILQNKYSLTNIIQETIEAGINRSAILAGNKQENLIKIYTDGACSGNPGKGGWGAVLMWGNHKKEINGFNADTTNNKMELTAVIEAIKAVKKSSEINIYTDSIYVKDGITKWILNWRVNGWKGKDKKPIKNLELWQELDLVAGKHKIDWHWVKGHSGDKYNEIADSLARKAIEDNK